MTVWIIVTFLTGYGFGKFGFGWVADAARWVWRKARPAGSVDHHPV